MKLAFHLYFCLIFYVTSYVGIMLKETLRYRFRFSFGRTKGVFEGFFFIPLLFIYDKTSSVAGFATFHEVTYYICQEYPSVLSVLTIRTLSINQASCKYEIEPLVRIMKLIHRILRKPFVLRVQKDICFCHELCNLAWQYDEIYYARREDHDSTNNSNSIDFLVLFAASIFNYSLNPIVS